MRRRGRRGQPSPDWALKERFGKVDDRHHLCSRKNRRVKVMDWWRRQRLDDTDVVDDDDSDKDDDDDNDGDGDVGGDGDGDGNGDGDDDDEDDDAVDYHYY